MNVLLVRTGGLGDTLLTMPVAGHIRNIYPDADFHILGNPMMLSVAKLFDIFDSYNSIDDAGFHNLYSHSGISDFIIDFFSQFNSVYFFTTADSKVIENKLRIAGVENIRIFNPVPVNPPGCHFSQFLAGIIDDDSHLNFKINIPPIKNFKHKIDNQGKFVIHPGSGGLLKNWPLENFIQTASQFKKNVTFVLGPAEKEKTIYKVLFKEGYHIEMPEDISELCELLSDASIYLGNDSGVSHLTGFLDIPSIVLFGPSDPVLWKPLGNSTRTIISPDSTVRGIPVCHVIEMIRDILTIGKSC